MLLLVLPAAVVLSRTSRTVYAQTPAALDDQTLLSLVLPPLSDGSRPGVHMWARADQLNGPAGLPTVFVVTLYTRQTGNGSEEREVVNYVQYSSGAWAAARPRDSGTLLVSDWAWVSLNLTNLTANVSGTGSSSQYTVDYTSSGAYSGSPRALSLEEVYASDLALTSSTVLSDSADITTGQPLATPAASAVAATVTATPSPAARPTATVPAGNAAGAQASATSGATSGAATSTARAGAPATPTSTGTIIPGISSP